MIKKTAVALALMAGFAGSAHAAIDFTFNYALANAAEGYAPANVAVPGFNNLNSPLSNITDELKFTAESLVSFTNAGTVTPFTAGSTFNDYVLVRIDQLFDNGNQNFDVYNLGTDRQITIALVMTGLFVSNQNYVFTGLSRFDMYYDAGASPATFTLANFNGPLGNFVDGTLVETGSNISGGGVTGLTVTDGALNLSVLLTDRLANGDFELSARGQLLSTVYAMVNGNNALCEADGGTQQACSSTEASLAAFFGAPSGPAVFHTRTDGSASKQAAVPEPQTLALMGLGLLGMGFAARRRKAK